MKTVLVPQTDIDKIENARQELWKLVAAIESKTIDRDHLNIFVANITQPMWYIGNRKYKETLISKIKRLLAKKSK